MSTPDTPHNTQLDAPGGTKNDAEPGAAHEEGRFHQRLMAQRPGGQVEAAFLVRGAVRR